MEKLTNYLLQRDLLSIAYYTESTYCRFIKCMSKKTGDSFLLEVIDLKVLTPPESYSIELTRIGSVNILEDSSQLALIDKNSDSKHVYEAIYLSEENNVFKNIYEQIKRIGYCFSKILPRPCIQFSGVLCQMKSDFTLRWFKTNTVQESPPMWDIVIFLTDLPEMESQIGKIQTKLFDILYEERKNVISKISSFNPQICAKKARELNSKEAELEKSIKAIKESIALLHIREKFLKEKRLKIDGLIKRTMNDDLASAENNKQSRETQRLILEAAQTLEKLNMELKSICLENEHKFHTLSNALKPFMN